MSKCVCFALQNTQVAVNRKPAGVGDCASCIRAEVKDRESEALVRDHACACMHTAQKMSRRDRLAKSLRPPRPDEEDSPRRRFGRLAPFLFSCPSSFFCCSFHGSAELVDVNRVETVSASSVRGDHVTVEDEELFRHRTFFTQDLYVVSLLRVCMGLSSTHLCFFPPA